MTKVEEYCPIGDMPKDWCAHCKKLPDPVVSYADDDMLEPIMPERRAVPWFNATRQARCQRCKEPVYVGDRVVSAEEGGYIGVCCNGLSAV